MFPYVNFYWSVCKYTVHLSSFFNLFMIMLLLILTDGEDKYLNTEIYNYFNKD